MKRLVVIAALCIGPLLLGACATHRKPPGQVVTTADANQAGIGGAVTAPLRDLSILKTKIPPVLINALNNPYQPPEPTDCAQIKTLVLSLNEALGSDFDQPASTGEDQDLITRGNDAALSAVAGAAQDFIPLRGWVRKLSGAEAHDRLVAASINAGSVRRAYLKGIGESKSCLDPAKPRANWLGASATPSPPAAAPVGRPTVEPPPLAVPPPPPVETPAPLPAEPSPAPAAAP